MIKKHPRGAISLIIVSVSILLLLSLPVVSNSLLRAIEPSINSSFAAIKSTVTERQKTQRVVIVVVSAGRQHDAYEYGNIDTVNADTLQRLNYATWLHKKLDLPLLLTGENGRDEATPDAVLMNQTLISSFSVVPIWIESESQNKAEIATNVSLFLKQRNITTLILVSHAIEMTRISYVFQKQGMQVLEAPIGLSSSRKGKRATHYLPNAKSLFDSSLALEEIITLLWYQIRY